MQFPEFFLKGVEFVGVGRQPFDGLYCRAIGLHREQQTRAHRLAIQQNRARAAHAMLTADMGAGETEIVAQEIRQEFARLHVAACIRGH